MNGIDTSTMSSGMKRRLRSRWFRIWWRRIHSWQDQEARDFALLRLHEIKWDPRLNNSVNKKMIVAQLNRKSRPMPGQRTDIKPYFDRASE